MPTGWFATCSVGGSALSAGAGTGATAGRQPVGQAGAGLVGAPDKPQRQRRVVAPTAGRHAESAELPASSSVSSAAPEARGPGALQALVRSRHRHMLARAPVCCGRSLAAVRDDLETLVLDVLEDLASDPDKKSQEIELKIAARLRRHTTDPKFVALGQRLEELRQRHEAGLLSSIDFLKHLLGLAKDVVAAEKTVDPEEDIDRGKAALTDLFQEVRTPSTPIIVERVVSDIDAIVRVVRFPGWQQTSAGEREVKRALRKTLLKYHLHQEQELFDRAYAYIKEYY